MATKYFVMMDLNGGEAITRAEFNQSSMSTMIKSFDALQPYESGLVKKASFIESSIKVHADPQKEA